MLELGLLLVDILDGLAVGGGGRRGLGRVDILLAEGSLGLLRRGGLLGLGGERGESMSDRSRHSCGSRFGAGGSRGACAHLGRRGDVLVDRNDLSDVRHDAR